MVQYLLNLESAMEAIEKRVPLGHFLVRVLLSLGVVAALGVVSRFLIEEFLLPPARLIVDVFARGLSGEPSHVPEFVVPRILSLILPWIVATILLVIVLTIVRRFTSRIYTQFKRLNEVVGTYELMFWRPLAQPEKHKLVVGMAALGSHTASIDADTSTDCVALANDIYDCLLAAKWRVSEIRWLEHHPGPPKTGGSFIWFKSSAPDFNLKAHNALITATRGPIGGHWIDCNAPLPSPSAPAWSDMPDMQIVLGPKKIFDT